MMTMVYSAEASGSVSRFSTKCSPLLIANRINDALPFNK